MRNWINQFTSIMLLLAVSCISALAQYTGMPGTGTTSVPYTAPKGGYGSGGSDRTFIEIEEEMKIVRAYLEIEKLRLGPKLQAEIHIDDAALHASIPMLSIQPLVENAIKHGVAPRMGNGFVRLSVTIESGVVSITVSNSGEFDVRALTSARGDGGIGLANVRRRLELCYGEETRFNAQAERGMTTVGFLLPLKLTAAI